MDNDSPRRNRIVALSVGSLLPFGLLTACSAGPATSFTSEGPRSPSAETGQKTVMTPNYPTDDEEEVPLKASDLSLSSLLDEEWLIEPREDDMPPLKLQLSNGVAEADSQEFSIGRHVSTDLNADGIKDVAVELIGRSGNGVNDTWYMWVAEKEGPRQVVGAIARTTNCGDTVESVEADDGGVVITEHLRTPSDAGVIPCAGEGSNTETRTVAAVKSPTLNEWWPVRIRPAKGYGGICPGVDDSLATFDTGEFYSSFYAAPDVSTDDLQDGRPVRPLPLIIPARLEEKYPTWTLVGFVDGNGENLRCGWVTR